ncbi:MAG: ABC transporter permease, partial [Verrucomicrobia bacterium]|nr:ABC transporter permease [Cytophagales bacterium]
ARISAVYNIFAYMMLFPLLYILPRLTDSLHPGQGGNPGFSAKDVDTNLRLVFYPAIIGWTLLGLWLASLRVRVKVLQRKISEKITA